MNTTDLIKQIKQDGIQPKHIESLIEMHKADRERMYNLYERYKAKHEAVPVFSHDPVRQYEDFETGGNVKRIDQFVNNKLNNAFDVEIVDTRTGYMHGVPIVYRDEDDEETKLIKQFNLLNNIPDKDSELIKLSDAGLGVTENNARHLINYIDLYIKEHDPEVEKVASRVGYINNQFVLPGATDIRIVTSGGLNDIVNSFKTSGTLQTYKEEVFDIIKDKSAAAFFLLVSLASPLLKHFDIDPFIVDLHGKTSQGKTTLLRLASSAWGTGNLVGEWNITKVALERKAAFLNNLPLLLDDTRKASPYVLKDAVYQFSGGKSKGRGNVNGIDEEISYKNIMLSTGEIALTEYNSEMAGIAARVIGISDIPIKKEEFKPLYAGMKENYGVIGREFISRFSKETKYYKSMMSILEGRYYDKAKGDDILTRIGRSFAVIHLAGMILNEIDGFEFDVESVMNDVYSPIADGTNTSYNKPKQLMVEFLEHLDGNRRHIKYEHGANDDNAQDFALVKSNGIYIPVKIINDFLEKEAKSIRKQWVEEGYIWSYAQGDTASLTFRSQQRRCIQIPRDIYERLGFNFEIID